MLPLEIGARPMIDFNVVDLPTPLRPIRQTICPSDTSTSTSNRTCAGP
jgi:hypothetical protein